MNRKKGWQFNVYLFSDHVIKIKTSYEETKNRVTRYLIQRNPYISYEEIDLIVKEVIQRRENSEEIIKNSKIPLKHLGNMQFLDNGIWQIKADILMSNISNKVRRNQLEQAKKTLDSFIDFTVELWRYGIFDIVYKLDGYGYIGKHMIIVDPFELTNDLGIIRKTLIETSWRRICQRYRFPIELEDYIFEQACNRLTYETLCNVWETY